MSTITVTRLLVVISCADCRVDFAIPRGWDNDFRRTGQSFYCPAGHINYYPGGKTDAQRLVEAQGELARVRDNAEFWKSQEKQRTRQLSAAKGRVTRIKNRVAKGVCPCCHRHFPQLERHMATQHPDYVEEKE